MSRCLFIHDFFQDGRLDVLAEVLVLQAHGQWTKQKRARWTKQAVTCYERSKHEIPCRPQGSSYYAGRIVGLRSAVTARYPKPDPQDKMLFLSMRADSDTICTDCGEKATWEWFPDGNRFQMMHLCDRCKQEQARVEVLTHASGWGWNEHELLPWPISKSHQLMQMNESELELAKVTFPLVALFACDLSNILWPTDHLTMLIELGVVLLIRWQSTNIARFLLFLIKSTEGRDS